MEIKTLDYKRCTVLQCEGRIDSASAPDVEKALMELISSGKAIIFDMSAVNFVSSAGWWSIIRVQKELKKRGHPDLILVGLNENVRDSMDLIGILPYFSTFDSLVEAIANV